MSFSKEDAKIILQDLLNKEFPKVAEKRKIVTREKEFAF